MNLNAQRLLIETGSAGPVSGLLIRPPEARVCFVFAHGAGAGMNHPFMEMFATGLDARGIATLRYQFPYMEKAAGDPIRRQLPRLPFGLPWSRRPNAFQDLC